MLPFTILHVLCEAVLHSLSVPSERKNAKGLIEDFLSHFFVLILMSSSIFDCCLFIWLVFKLLQHLQDPNKDIDAEL